MDPSKQHSVLQAYHLLRSKSSCPRRGRLNQSSIDPRHHRAHCPDTENSFDFWAERPDSMSGSDFIVALDTSRCTSRHPIDRSNRFPDDKHDFREEDGAISAGESRRLYHRPKTGIILAGSGTIWISATGTYARHCSSKVN